MYHWILSIPLIIVVPWHIKPHAKLNQQLPFNFNILHFNIEHNQIIVSVESQE